jgi:hypothetical protein
MNDVLFEMLNFLKDNEKKDKSHEKYYTPRANASKYV